MKKRSRVWRCPLPAGERTIHIFASDDATFTVDVTYLLTVE